MMRGAVIGRFRKLFLFHRSQPVLGLLFLRSIVVGASAQVRVPAGAELVELEAKQQRKEGNVFFADGDVDIRYQDLRLRADHVEYNADTSEALARGHIQLECNSQHLEADEARYNVRTGRGIFRRVRGTVQVQRRPNPNLLVTPNPLYFEGERLECFVRRQLRLPPAVPAEPVGPGELQRSVLRNRARISPPGARPGGTENQFRVTLIIANIGTFGNLRRQERIF
jgi:hypothetical protein